MVTGSVCVSFLSTVAACIFVLVKQVPLTPENTVVFMTIKSVLDTTLGAIIGFLVNTRTAEVKLDGTKTETTTSITKTPSPDSSTKDLTE
jgi:hypothetical protein